MTEPQTTPGLGIVAAFSGFAVPDIDAARAFYADTLGLTVRDGGMGLLRLELPGGAEVMVYPKPDHVPAVFTILNFAVSDIDAAVDALLARGVSFERYPGSPQDDKGIAHDPRGPQIAWFTDPAGNILSVLQNVLQDDLRQDDLRQDDLRQDDGAPA